MMLEIWKNVAMYPGLKASSFGRILAPPSVAKMPHGGERSYRPKPTYGLVVRANKKAAHSYRGIHYKKYGNIKVHQAVCDAFHGPKPFESAVVIHLDSDAHNNKPENLKWGTQKENLNHPKFISYCKARKGQNSPFAKATIRNENELLRVLAERGKS